MKKIEDYLPFYLGCEVTNKQPGLGTFTYKLMAEHLDLYDPQYDTIILRPLSSMSEEEAIELAGLSEWEGHFRDVKTKRNKFNDIIVSWQGMCETREEFNSTGELFYCAEQFQYLLKKRFDLFQLIESGHAIDATTLKPKDK